MRTRQRNVRARGPLGGIMTLSYTDSQIAGGYFGYHDTTTNATRRFWDQKDSVWFGVVNGTDASMAWASGDSSPCRVVVDNGAEVTPVLSGGSVPLFAGLSDGPHFVQVRPDNTAGTGTYTAMSGPVMTVTGRNPSVAPAGVQWFTKDPAFPGLETIAQGAPNGTNYLPNFNRASVGAGYGVTNGSVHFRAKAQDVYVFTGSTSLWYSVDGGVWTREDFPSFPNALNGYCRTWKKLTGASGSASSFREFAISDSPNASTRPLEGVLVTGSGATLEAPGVTKHIVHEFGASQVFGAGVDTMGSVDINRLQSTIPTLAAAQTGLSGAVIYHNSGGAIVGTSAVSNFAAWAASIKTKQTILFSIGINSADDANFQPDYVLLINAALNAGFGKVICRGLIQASSSNTGKNAKIAAAVAAVNDARVVYADVSTWQSSTDGSLGIWMPDGAHPNDTGYATMAAYGLRDHASLLQ